MRQSAIRRRIGRYHRAPRRRDRRRHPERRLFAETLDARLLLTAVTGVDPLANSHNAPKSTDVAVEFDQDINAATVSVQSLVMRSGQSGSILGGNATFAVAGPTVTVNPAADFYPGELVEVTATSAIQSTAAAPVVPHVWQFRTAVSGGSGQT